MVENVIKNIEENYKIEIKFDETASKKLLYYSTKELSMGGRGIGNKIEEIFINPLSSVIFELKANMGDIIEIYDLGRKNGIWKLIAKKSSAI